MKKRIENTDDVRHAEHIERNLRVVAALGVVAMLGLLVALVVVQGGLGRSITSLSSDVIPIQGEVAELNDAIGNMFLNQSNLDKLDLETLNALEADNRDRQTARRSQKALQEFFEAERIAVASGFPQQAADQLDAAVTSFLKTRSELFRLSRTLRLQKNQFEATVVQIQQSLKDLLQQSSGLSGVLRLDYVVRLRLISQELDENQLSSEEVKSVILGDARMQMESIASFNLAAQRLDALAGKIAAARNTDVLNSLAHNEVKQNATRLDRILDEIDSFIDEPEQQRKLDSINDVTKNLVARIGEVSLPNSLALLRRDILRREAEMSELQQTAKVSADLLKRCTRTLMHFSEDFASETSQSASSTITASRIATVSIALIGLVLMVVAGFRVQRSIVALRHQNEQLSRLSSDLSDINLSLEKAVELRTASLQTVLDNTGDGVFVADLDGIVLPERSKSIEDWFGRPKEECFFWNYLAGKGTPRSGELQMGFEQLVAEILPFEVSADQLPDQFRRGTQTYSLQFRPIREVGRLSRVLIIVQDITLQLEAEKAQKAVQDLQLVIGNLMKDRNGFMQFVKECSRLIEEAKSCLELGTSQRILHTIKGNCGIMGLRSVAEFLHKLEDVIKDEQRIPTGGELLQLENKWKHELKKLGSLLDNSEDHIAQIRKDELQSMLNMLETHAAYDEMIPLVSKWIFEPLSLPLNRLAKQASRLAKQLGKEVRIEVEDRELYMPEDRLKSFWPTLIHIVRNSVDHGLETPEERMQSNKSEICLLRFDASVSQGWLELRLSDDGRGINWDRVRQKAKKLELPNETKDDLVEALFSDGFSTNERATDLSGRGVGLSAVRSACESLGGSISIVSKHQEGTSFIVRFPWERGLADSPEILGKRNQSTDTMPATQEQPNKGAAKS